MVKKRRIIEGHTLDQYDKRYGKAGLKKVQKKYADKDETLLDGSNWWLVDETYYELPKNPFGYWWKNLSKAGKVALCLLGVGAITTGVVVPVVLTTNQQSHVEPEPTLEYLEFKDIDDKTCSVSLKADYKKEEAEIKDGTIVIPSTYQGKKVTEIADCAFIDLEAGQTPSSFKNVVIPNTVTKIGQYAFAGCNIEMVSMPDSLISIEEGAFYYCKNLQSITFNDKLKSIGEMAFYYCNELARVVIPDSVTKIGKSAFEKCDKLEFAKIGNGIKTIENGTFKNCVLLKDIELGENTTIIGTSAFYSCESLEEITLPEKVVGILERAFGKCSKLTSVSIPKNVVYIGREAFNDCSGLETVILNEGLHSIGDSAFINCAKLTNINIPNSVTSIGDDMFKNCDKIKTIEDNNAKYIGNEENPYLLLLSATDTSITSCNINSKCKFIQNYAFENCSNLEDVIIPDSVVSIGYKSFEYCYNIKTTADTEKKLYYLGNKNNDKEVLYSANNCEKSNLTIDSNTKIISYYSYNSNRNIEYITLNENITSIGESAFSDCSNLVTVDINNNNKLQEIGKSAFANTKLSTFAMPDTVYRVQVQSFRDCPNLYNISFSKNLEVIESGAFSNSGLITVEIPSNVMFIGEWAYDSCESLEKVYIDSAIIAGLDYSSSRLLDNEATTTVFVKKDIGLENIGSYILDSFELSETKTHDEYYVFERKAEK